jgi:DNA polymerase III delta subunit
MMNWNVPRGELLKNPPPLPSICAVKQFRSVIPVEPYTPAELQAVLEAEAAESHISFEPGAAELLVGCS